MLGLVAAQLKYKVDNKEIRAGEAVWVDVSYICTCFPGLFSWKLMLMT